MGHLAFWGVVNVLFIGLRRIPFRLMAPTVANYKLSQHQLYPTLASLLTVQTTSSITSTLPVPQPTATECASKNATGYVIGADKFDLFCDINWAGYDMYLNFTRDFFSCMDGCVRWNENATEVCVGVAYSPQNYGPRGLAGGTQCFYKWTMPNGQEASFVGLDNARLNLTSPGSSVIYPF